MSTGAFRDGSAALERARMLGNEVEALKLENASLRERADALLAGLDENKLAAQLKKALEERDAQKRENEDQHLAHIAVVQRIKEESKAFERTYDSKLQALQELEARLQPETQALEQAHVRDAVVNAQRLVAITKERDALAIRLATGVETAESNITAVLKRVMDERDDALRELHQLRASTSARKPAPSFLKRLFR